VIDIIDQGALSRITVDVGILINVLITNQSLEDLIIKTGKEVWLTFKAYSVHTLREDK